MENLVIKVESFQAENAVKKLVRSLAIDKSVSINGHHDLWGMFEQLNVESFTGLRFNVYFADLFKSIQISVSNENSVPNLNTENDEDSSEVEFDSELSDVLPVSSNCDVVIPSLMTSLDDLELPERFLKLVKRLRSVSLNYKDFILGDTLGELIGIRTSEIIKLPGVGISYVNTFKELKKLINGVSSEDSSIESPFNKEIIYPLTEIENMRLVLAGVDSPFTKALEKFARYLQVDDLSESLLEIISLNRKELIQIPSFGLGMVDKLLDFRKLIIDEIEAINEGSIDYKNFESSLLVPKMIENMAATEIERILLEDIDTYLDKISDEDADILQKRWGFVEDKKTLEEIGNNLKVTRERIRQKESKINRKFIQNLRISPQVLWQFVEPILNLNIQHVFKNLFSCFSSEQDFYEFLNLVCDRVDLYEYVYPEFDKSILNTFFAEFGAPIVFNDAKDYLASLNISTIRNETNAINYLGFQGVIFIEGDYIWPRQLGKAEASACVLVNHDKGLPWLDVAKLVNSNKYSRTEIYEDRLDHEAFNLPDFIFLAGKGVYKHTRFIDPNGISIDDLFNQLREYFQLNPREAFHLNEFYQASSVPKVSDYYIIRHFVKNFGEDYGFYFDGRSQVDSIGMRKGFKNVTQKDVIIEAMNSSNRPITKPEIANLLKSKSLNHASFYLDNMMDEGTVVQVDRMLYTTPEVAYKNVDINDYVNAIEAILKKYGKPVEPSIFKEELNLMFTKSYSKYFYASIARLYYQRIGWHRKQGLYSFCEIPFNSLKALLDLYCSPEKSIKENADIIQEYVAITDETAIRAVLNWR